MASGNYYDPIKNIEEALGSLPRELLVQLAERLSPLSIEKRENIFGNLFRSLQRSYKNFYPQTANINDPALNEILLQAAVLNQELRDRLKGLLAIPRFVAALRRGNEQQNSTSLQQVNEKPPFKTKSIFNFEVIKDPFSEAKSAFVDRHQNRAGFNRVTQFCPNLSVKYNCICGKNPQDVELGKEPSFRCISCNRSYHNECMRKKNASQYCAYCHLKYISPVRKVIRVIYVGLMRKGILRHDMRFMAPYSGEIGAHRIQLRCVRLKESAQGGVLFPDITSLILNNTLIKQFQPLSKQSCLKYRKDEPLWLSRSDLLLGHQNLLTLTEKLAHHRQRDLRNQPENHLLGIYLVEDIKPDDLVKTISEQSVLPYEKSQELLQDSFHLGRCQQISCQLVKIPLTCGLTTERISIAVRGIFCQHFQCFDARNFIILISESQNPRWKCPICAAPSYELIVDPILTAIIAESSTIPTAKEVLFFKNGDYTLVIDEEPSKDRKNIADLPIPQRLKNKRGNQEQPKRRTPFVIPSNAKIIEID